MTIEPEEDNVRQFQISMDFDLFESENDDILGSMHLESTQKHPEPSCDSNDDLPEFQCGGDDSNNAQFNECGFIRKAFTCSLERHTLQNAALQVSLSTYGFTFPHLSGQSVAQYLFGEAFINVQNMVASVQGTVLHVNADKSYYQRRQHVTRLLHLILYCTCKEQWPFLRTHVSRLRDLVNRISTEETWKLIYFANSTKGNESNVPAYHLLHGLLEWKLLDIWILYKNGLLIIDQIDDTNNRESENLKFKTQLQKIFTDLLTCSLLLFTKKQGADIFYSSPFPCTCFKELWLVLVTKFKEWAKLPYLEQEQLNFWKVLKEAMSQLKLKIGRFSISNISFCEFNTWIFVGLTRLHGYRSSGVFEGPQYGRNNLEPFDSCDFFEQNTQEFLTLNPNEEQIRTHICLITPIILDWHHPRAAIPILLWEYFHKRLSSSFYIAGAPPSNLAVACGSGRAYLERYRMLLAKSQTGTPDINLSSYTLFTLLLGRCLEHLRTLANFNQTQKLLGRLYSKFSLQKLLALNECGIHHLIELFLMLALCGGDFKEMLPKLRDSLLSIGLDKITTQRQVAVIKGHVALLILCAEQQLDLTEYIAKVLQQLNSIKNDVAVTKILADGLLDIFQHSNGSFQNGEHFLIDTWLPSFLQNSTPVEQERTFEALHLIFIKLEETKTNDFCVDTRNDQVIKALYSHLLPFIKQQYVHSFSDKLPLLAADFCINVEETNFRQFFNFFIETPTASRQALPQILLNILKNDVRSSLLDPIVLMHIWLRSLVLLTPQHAIVKRLTKHISELKLFHKITNLTAEDILEAKEPLCVFVAAVGKIYDAADCQLRYEVADNFNELVRNFEKWLNCITDSSKLLDNQQHTEVTFRFYSFLAIVIYNCPLIVYAKSKSTCFFHIAISRFILPTSIQIGKQPEGKLTQLVHKIWPVVAQGIGRLSYKTDAYIQKTLDDLIQKWTPFFKTISSNTKVVARPFIACFQSDNYGLSLHVCERLTTHFITTQRRQADPNACLVIAMFQEIVNTIIQEAASNQNNQTQKDSAEKRLCTLMKGTCLLTLEHIMMVDEVVPSRGMLLELFRHIIESTIFVNSVSLQDLFIEHLRILTKKHLAFYTFFYFDLLMKIAHISYRLVERIIDFVVEEISIVEEKRSGGGEDNRLRNCLRQLKELIRAEKVKNKKPSAVL